MMGAFIQVNIGRRLAHLNPIGYVIEESGCWTWVGFIDKDGYGRWNCNVTGSPIAHRAVYILKRGPIPDGLTLDHLCRNRSCVNPDHMEAVTNKENLMRGTSFSAQNATKTHCKRGHALSGENLYVYQGRRYCRACGREWGRAARRAA